jgi:hypothetical protein
VRQIGAPAASARGGDLDRSSSTAKRGRVEMTCHRREGPGIR